MKEKVVIKRLYAFLIDYLIILVYIGLLFCAALVISNIFHLNLSNVDPFTGELISFAFLTLPVLLYFTLSENSKFAGTMGKRKFGLQVVSNNLTKAGITRLLIRNGIKFLPWELAHYFVYQLFYFHTNNQTIPGWVLAGLIAAQVLAISYLAGIIFLKKNQTVYELLSRTKVLQI